MGFIGNLACKTIGLAGISAVVYDAYSVGKSKSKKVALSTQADTFEKIVAAERTTSNVSPLTGAMQRKVADLRMSNPLIPIWGRVKGFLEGSMNSVGDNVVLAGFASMALGGKGFFGKLGAWGTAGFVGYKVLKEGFGVGKKSPVDS